MNRGDTVTLMLNYQVNGEDLQNGAYEEIELQINNESSTKSIKKLLSTGEIRWETVEYTTGGGSDSFTGYVVHLSQDETFLLNAGQSSVQLRIKQNNQVGSSSTSMFTLGAVLSSKVL